MSPRVKKFFSYYKPYLGLFYADMACAIIVSATILAVPLCISYITKNLEAYSPDVLNQIYIMGSVMVSLVAIHAIARAFVDYKGHVMGALMEKDMRNELFEHYQKLSFKFYDDHRTGQLMLFHILKRLAKHAFHAVVKSLVDIPILESAFNTVFNIG